MRRYVLAEGVADVQEHPHLDPRRLGTTHSGHDPQVVAGLEHVGVVALDEGACPDRCQRSCCPSSTRPCEDTSEHVSRCKRVRRGSFSSSDSGSDSITPSCASSYDTASASASSLFDNMRQTEEHCRRVQDIIFASGGEWNVSVSSSLLSDGFEEEPRDVWPGQALFSTYHPACEPSSAGPSVIMLM